MKEQLDLFIASITEEPEEEKNPQETSLTTRQWALYRLIEYNSLTLHRATTQKEICIELEEFGYEWNDNPSIHDHCITIWNDITANNLSMEHDCVIIADNFRYWIGSKKETMNFLQKLWRDLSPRLKRYWNYVKKVGYDGQGKLYDKNLNPIDDNNSSVKKFHDCFNDYDVTMQQFVEENKNA